MILEIFQETCGAVAIAHEEVTLHAGSSACLLLEIGSSTQNVAGQIEGHQIFIGGVNQISSSWSPSIVVFPWIRGKKIAPKHAKHEPTRFLFNHPFSGMLT